MVNNGTDHIRLSISLSNIYQAFIFIKHFALTTSHQIVLSLPDYYRDTALSHPSCTGWSAQPTVGLCVSTDARAWTPMFFSIVSLEKLEALNKCGFRIRSQKTRVDTGSGP